MRFLQILKENSKLIWFLSVDDLKKRYAGSALGIFWAFVQPCVTILIYWFVFQVGLKSTAPGNGNIPFIVWIMCGLIPWFFFSDCLNTITNVFIEYSYLVKKVVFNIEILPVIKLISCLVVHLFFILLLLLVMAVFGYFPTISFLQILYYLFCSIALVLSLGYIFSSIAVFFRDMGQFVQVALQAGMWLTPILWAFSTIEGNWFAPIFKLNPMFYIVEGYRTALLNGIWFWERGWVTVYFWALILLLTIVANYVFNKLRPHFADVL